MSIRNRQNLKADFETGDTLTQDAFEDLIDSSLNLVDTSAQSLASNLSMPNLATNSVSAQTVYSDNVVCVGYVLNRNPVAEVYTTTTASLGAWTSGLFQPMTQTFQAPLLNAFSVSGNTLTYTATVTATCEILADVQLKASSSAGNFSANIYHNGFVEQQSYVNKPFSAGEKAQMNLMCLSKLKPNDTLQVYLGQEGALSAMEVHGCHMIVKPVYWG